MPSEGAQPNIQFRVQNVPSLPTPAPAFNSRAVTARSEPRPPASGGGGGRDGWRLPELVRRREVSRLHRVVICEGQPLAVLATEK